MGLGKQAKTLSKGQVEAVLGYLAKTRWPKRNRVIFLLSAKAGLRAKEIAGLTWMMVNDSQGEIGRTLCLLDSASKGKSGRWIPLSDEVREALIEYRDEVNLIVGPHVIRTERALSTSPQALVNMFQRWYRHLGFVGCSSHSGRRTFITNAARKISTVGGSLRDVQMLPGTRTSGRLRGTSTLTRRLRFGSWSSFSGDAIFSDMKLFRPHASHKYPEISVSTRTQKRPVTS